MKKAILLVEDDPSLRVLGRTILEGRGYEVVEAGSGKAAIRELEQRDFDVILLDLDIPEGRGEFVMLWIAGHRPFASNRVVIVSGDPIALGEEVTLARLEISFVPKPYSASALIAAVEKIIQ